MILRNKWRKKARLLSRGLRMRLRFHMYQPINVETIRQDIEDYMRSFAVLL